jgi:hypothetical protein
MDGRMLPWMHRSGDHEAMVAAPASAARISPIT